MNNKNEQNWIIYTPPTHTENPEKIPAKEKKSSPFLLRETKHAAGRCLYSKPRRRRKKTILKLICLFETNSYWSICRHWIWHRMESEKKLAQEGNNRNQLMFNPEIYAFFSCWRKKQTIKAQIPIWNCNWKEIIHDFFIDFSLNANCPFFLLNYVFCLHERLSQPYCYEHRCDLISGCLTQTSIRFYPQSLYLFQFLIYRTKMVLCSTKTYFFPSNRHRLPRSLMKEEQGNRERIW